MACKIPQYIFAASVYGNGLFVVRTMKVHVNRRAFFRYTPHRHYLCARVKVKVKVRVRVRVTTSGPSA
jgi:hypothetical protein